MLRMDGKVAIVAGAGSVGPSGSKIWGNGKATAVLLARQGASVFLVDLNEDAVAETKSIIDLGLKDGVAQSFCCLVSKFVPNP